MKQYQFAIDTGVVQVRCSDRNDGSFALSEPTDSLTERRHRLLGADADRSWVGLQQVHGAAVLLPREDGGMPHGTYPEADAVVSFDDAYGISVLTADCAPVVLIGSTGVAVVHAGWKGAAAGVIEAAAEALRSEGAQPVATVLGPCIQPAAYEFGAEDLLPIVAAFGPDIVGRTTQGTDALDLVRVVQICCERAGWPVPERSECTSQDSYYSHRTRADKGRQATVAWIDRSTHENQAERT